MAEPGGVPPEGDEPPPIVRLLEGLDEQGERLKAAVSHVRRLWWALALVIAGMLVLGVAYKVQLDNVHRIAARTDAVARRNTVLVAKVAALGVSTTRSLCGLRHDLESRVAEGDKFLRRHPHGIPGIPAKTLRVSIDGQRRTIVVLSNLKCKAAAHLPSHGNP